MNSFTVTIRTRTYCISIGKVEIMNKLQNEVTNEFNILQPSIFDKAFKGKIMNHS